LATLLLARISMFDIAEVEIVDDVSDRLVDCERIGSCGGLCGRLERCGLCGRLEICGFRDRLKI